MADDKIFANGLIFKAPRENAPDFVKGSISVKVDEFVAFLQANNTNSGWVNIDIKESKGGKIYCELNTYKPERPNIEPKEDVPTVEYPEDDIDPASIPF
jgi:hypothetical protein